MPRHFRRLLTFFLWCCGLIAPAALSADAPLLPTSLELPKVIPAFVRVVLSIDLPSVEIQADGAYRIENISGNVIAGGRDGLKGAVRAAKDGIQVRDEFYAERVLVVQAEGDGLIQVGKRRYQGRIRFLWKSEQALTVVNEIELEEYLKGVLPLEVSPAWPMEALKAQAVISRTFALFKTIEKQGQEFTIRDTVLGQVYGGALFHKAETDEAVESTRGKILTSDGKIFPAYFFAACGGQTAQADLIWKVEPNPVFQSVSCLFCKGTKHDQWTLRLPLGELESIMNQNGFPAKNLKRIEMFDRDPSGRARKVRLQYEHSKVAISADDFRAFLGYDRLRSLKAEVNIDAGKAIFRGSGWGHGIGFCQWGSKRQAELGKNYREILKFYFPGSKIKTVKS